jgi:hypothetical protein
VPRRSNLAAPEPLVIEALAKGAAAVQELVSLERRLLPKGVTGMWWSPAAALALSPDEMQHARRHA